ncbi:hypothetical protein V1L52_03035 [Treponema sp. HNW]|uniref:hypothetical protein n=1 Tax=Treponema sp. HNW TaxID=3116654 RepID=UPI003D1444C3
MPAAARFAGKMSIFGNVNYKSYTSASFVGCAGETRSIKANGYAASFYAGIGYRVSGIGYRVSGIGYRVSGIGYRVSGIGYRVSGIGYRVSGIGYRVSGIGYRVSGIGYRVSGIGYRVSKALYGALFLCQELFSGTYNLYSEPCVIPPAVQSS